MSGMYRLFGLIFFRRFAFLLQLIPDFSFLAPPKTLDVIVMTQQYQTGKHGDRESEFWFEPLDVKRCDQRTDNRAQRRVSAQQHGQQPCPHHQPG